ENGTLARYFTETLKQSGHLSIKDYPAARPSFIEKEAVVRASLLAREAKAPLNICHLSSGSAAKELRRIKKEGNIVYAETCPQYLLLSEDIFKGKEGFMAASCPPVRKEEDRYELWRSIIEGGIDTIGTDHCPFSKAKKSAPGDDFTKIPMGLPGVETSLPLFYSEGVLNRGIDIKKMVNLMSANPAKIHGLYPQKGSMDEGTDADIVIFNPSRKGKIKASSQRSAAGWTPYEKFKITGAVEYTISRGKIVYEKGEIKGKKGRGKFLKRGLPAYYSV
ncbi:MAG: amidohydrolase family protein, partial [Elusimicrobiota bacterium]|nr:amidohydrolase family protein [Elusimicrobiota bacterium]